MWISKADYFTMVDKTARAETRADWLLTQINLLQTEIGALKYRETGTPQPIPIFKREATPTVDPAALGETSFDDLGDDLARQHGYKE